jgi:hypothetical protein
MLLASPLQAAAASDGEHAVTGSAASGTAALIRAQEKRLEAAAAASRAALAARAAVSCPGPSETALCRASAAEFQASLERLGDAFREAGEAFKPLIFKHRIDALPRKELRGLRDACEKLLRDMPLAPDLDLSGLPDKTSAPLRLLVDDCFNSADGLVSSILFLFGEELADVAASRTGGRSTHEVGPSAKAIKPPTKDFGLRIVRTVPLPEEKPLPGYTHQAELDVFVTREDFPSLEQVLGMAAQAQKAFDACRVRLRVRSYTILAASDEFRAWESAELFSFGSVSDWEKAFFSLTRPRSAGVLFVESINLSVGLNGVTAVAYGPYMVRDLPPEDRLIRDESEIPFFLERMAGYAVLGESARTSTLAHELGHAVLDLPHEPADQGNLMFPQYDRGGEGLTPAQCRRGLANAQRARPF